MPINKESTAESLYDLLSVREFDIETLDSTGSDSVDIKDADVFSFDFKHQGVNYGPVVIILTTDNKLELLAADSLGKHMDDVDARNSWFGFLEQISKFSRRRGFTSFDIDNINRSPYRMKQAASQASRLDESWRARGRRYSENAGPQKTTLRIRHSRALDEQDARYRCVESLFIETQDGERYKLPFTNLAGGRAMARHCAEGGRPWDQRGMHITDMVKEAAVLGNFLRRRQNPVTEQAEDLLEKARRRRRKLKHDINRLKGSRGYGGYFGSWDGGGDGGGVEESLLEQVRQAFVVEYVDPTVESAAPYLAKLKEIDQLDDYLQKIEEGTWSLPEDDHEERKLIQLLSRPLRLGAEAMNATAQLEELLGDDQLFDQLHDAAEKDPEADARPVILRWMKLDGSHHDIINRLHDTIVAKTDIEVDQNGDQAPKIKTQPEEPEEKQDPADVMRHLSGITQKTQQPNPRGDMR